MDLILLGLGLSAFQLLNGAAALRRLYKVKSSEGYSYIAEGIILGSAPGWLTVAIMANNGAFIASYVCWTIVTFAVACLVLLYGEGAPKRFFSALGLTLAVTALGATAGFYTLGVLTVLGVLMALIDLSFGVPKLHAGLTSATTAGLSMASMLISLTMGFIHLAAGVLADEPIWGYIFYGTFVFCYVTPVLARVASRRLRGLA